MKSSPSRCQHWIGKQIFSSFHSGFALTIYNKLTGEATFRINFVLQSQMVSASPPRMKVNHFLSTTGWLFFLSHTELIIFCDILSADHVLFLTRLNSVSSKVTSGEKSKQGPKACEHILDALGSQHVGGLELERSRAGSVHHLSLHLKALLQSCLGGSRFISENPEYVSLWHQRDHKNLLHKVTIKLISLPRTCKGLRLCNCFHTLFSEKSVIVLGSV